MSLHYDAAKTLLHWTLPADLFDGLMMARERRRTEETRHRLQVANDTTIERLLKGGEPIRLDLAAERKRSGWTSVDMNSHCDLRLDLTEPLPFPDESVAMVYASHFLEHLQYPSPMLDFLHECQRILKRGGVMSVAVPNIEPFLNAYNEGDLARTAELCSYDVQLAFKSPIDYLNYVAYMGGQHRHLFDSRNLPLVLGEVGFRGARMRTYDETIDIPSRRSESIYAEGVK